MKIIKKEKLENGKRRIYFCGKKILSYTKKDKSTVIEKETKIEETKNEPVVIQEQDILKVQTLMENKKLFNTAKNKRCFLLATGASIKQQDLSKLQGEECYSISNFFLHKDINIIKPKLHFFAPYHEPLILENYIDWMNLADSKLPSETNMVLGYSNKYLVEKYNLFPKRKIYYLDLTARNDVEPDIEKYVMSPQTGPIMMLPVLDYIGHEEIYLIGMDMNRLANYQGVTSNFYDKDPRINATDGAGWADIITELKRTCVMFEQFLAYQNFFIEKGKSMYNLSPISWLSFIEKKDFNETLQKENSINE